MDTIDLTPQAILGADGQLAQHFSNYEERKPQIQMANAVRHNMEQHRKLFCEAGTGTGKSYAFLIPAIERSLLMSDGPVVVSTGTIALQEQIFNKDIPDLKRYLDLPHLKVMLSKGRGNYISKRRLMGAINNVPVLEKDIQGVDVEDYLNDLPEWAFQEPAASQHDGSKQIRDDIPNPYLWDEVRSDNNDCLGRKCPFHSTCYYYRAKEQAKNAHIIITNHALLVLDAKIKASAPGKGLLPDYKHLIIDEAHMLEEAIRGACTCAWRRCCYWRLRSRVEQMMDKIINQELSFPINVISQAKALKKEINALNTLNETFFDNCVEPFVTDTLERGATARRLRPGDLANFVSTEFAQLSDLFEKNKKDYKPLVEELLEAAGRAAKRASQVLEECSRHTAEGKEYDQFADLFGKVAERLHEVYYDLELTVSAKEVEDIADRRVCYVEVSQGRKRTNYVLTATPIFVKNLSRALFFEKNFSITLTSATLSYNRSFKNITRTLGAVPEDTDGLLLPHVFDYQKQCAIIITTKMPDDPRTQGAKQQNYYDSLANKAKIYINKTKGNALVLCTSNKIKTALFERLRPMPYNVLCQGHGMPNDYLIKEFKAVSGSVLIGVDSFWAGIDIPGDHLQCIVIPKLPFAPPTPLSEAQQEIIRDWNLGKPPMKRVDYWSEWVMPAVAIKLQQGFGRLIRRTTDRGIVAILDPRLKTKRYGQALLNSLPDCRVIIDSDPI